MINTVFFARCTNICITYVSVCVWHFDFYKLPKSNVMNANILCLVRFQSEQISAVTDPGPEHVRPDRTNITRNEM